jgi:hypothetical protein
MKNETILSIAIVLALCAIGNSQTKPEFVIYDGKELANGYDMGINTSSTIVNWLKDKGNELVLSYPTNQDWGAAFVTVGKPKQSASERQSKDFSTFDSLIISLKGAKGGESVDIGIKDKTDPDDGSEIKKTITLTKSYVRYALSLRDFDKTADLPTLYVVAEFVFGPNSPCIIYINSISYK